MLRRLVRAVVARAWREDCLPERFSRDVDLDAIPLGKDMSQDLDAEAAAIVNRHSPSHSDRPIGWGSIRNARLQVFPTERARREKWRKPLTSRSDWEEFSAVLKLVFGRRRDE